MQFDSLVKKIFNENSHYMIINFIFALLPYIWLVIVVTLIIGLKRKIFNKFFRILFVLALLLLIIPIYANTVERFWIIKREKVFTYDKSKQTKK